jgi:hypothetical protein
LVAGGECMPKHGHPGLLEEINKRKGEKRTRIPILLQYFLSLQCHAPEILETACRYDECMIYDHNLKHDTGDNNK